MQLLKNLNYRVLASVMIFFFPGMLIILADTIPQPVKWQDVAEWKFIPGASATISNDGQWFAYWYSPNKGNSEVMVQSTADTTRKSFNIGETPNSYGSPGAIEFSHDSRFIAFYIYPGEEEKKDPENPPANKLSLVDLKNGTKTIYEDVKSFSFSGENPGWLAVHLNTPKPSRDKMAGKGTDLLLVELSSGNKYNFGNVSVYSFDKQGKWLAWLTDAYNKAGNGLQLRNMDTGNLISPENDSADYRYINWTKEGDGLAILKSAKNDDFEDEVYSVIGIRGFSESDPEKIVYDPHTDPLFPDSMSISPNQQPSWSENLNTLFFGICRNEKKEADKKPDEEEAPENDTIPAPKLTEKPSASENDDDDDEKTDVIIWHWQDKRLQSVQKNRENSDKNASYLSLYHTKENRFIRLADEDLRNINVAPKQKYAIGLANGEYELWGSLSGQNFADVYIIDLETGDRKMILEKHIMLGGLNVSPDGEKFVYYSEGNYFSCSFSSSEIYPLTSSIPSTFINEESDRNVPMPPTPFMGWTSNSNEVLIRDNWNIWKVSANGKKFENLTLDGVRNGKRYQSRFRLDPEEEGIDLNKPMFVRVFDERTKESGITRFDKGKPGAVLLFNDHAVYNNLVKARDRDIFIFTKETVTDQPDYYLADNINLNNSRKITEIYPEQENYSLSPGSRLITYVSDKGDTLQAALYLPAGYQEGQKYPAVVYIYERLTQGLNTYSRPVFPGGGFNRAMYTSNGYAVLMPDITYELNDPGMSAVWCVIPAVDKAIETGVIDPDNIAIHGHSWGGYQTSFLITQTDKFKAAVAGAPLTNMISMYSLIYWNSGGTNQAIFESSQGRLTTGYWDNMDAFQRNSPVYFAKNVNTPLLLMHNDEDGAVDFTQGIEYYNTLRRLNKPVIMLQYEGENHGLAKTPNQIDYALRMMEFLDYHLKGEEASDWIIEGVPLLEMEKHLEERPSVLK